MPTMSLNAFFVLTFILICLSSWPQAYAYGAGHLIENSHLDSRSFRHGDFAEELVEIVKIIAGSMLAKKLAESRQKDQKDQKSKSSKDKAKHPVETAQRKLAEATEDGEQPEVYFDETDSARLYFGNWLRDMSQVLDIGLLKGLGPGALTNLVCVLGFFTFSRATREFEVTEERLGCYRHEEHIDNPHGYPDGAPEGSDPRELAGGYQGLRGPVRKEEIQVEERTGMKNYIANEDGDWDTSSRYLRKSIVKSIELGRIGLSEPKKQEDYWESLRLLGQACHVMEDFMAHSNWTELMLLKLGYQDVFCYVGKNIRIRAPDGSQVPPLITGTFGGSDAMHSMIGEGADKLAEIGTSDLSEALLASKSSDSSLVKKLFDKIVKLSKGTGEDSETEEDDEDADTLVDKLQSMREKTGADGEDVHKAIVSIFKIHDVLARKLVGSTSWGNSSSTLKTFVLATLEPLISPILTAVAKSMVEVSASVIDEAELTKALEDPDLENPSHSVLAKDHLNQLLNGPSGLFASILFESTVKEVVAAWNDFDIEPAAAANRIIKFLHHPFFADEKNEVHVQLQKRTELWMERLGEEKDEVLSRLTQEAIINHKNTTEGLKYASAVRAQVKKPKAIQYARKGLWGLCAVGLGKLGLPCCKEAGHDSDLEENIIQDDEEAAAAKN